MFGWLSTLGSEFVTITEMFFHLEVCQSNQHSLPKNKLVLFFFFLYKLWIVWGKYLE